MSESPTPPPALLITGMHRSGTSVTASLMQAAGLFLGDRLLGPSPSNTPGHFEDLDFFAIDQRLLTAHGLPEDGLTTAGPVHPGPRFRAEAGRLVDDRRGRGGAWGWKDPRAALLLDFWAEVIPEARFLFVFRPPWEVIDSLYRRGEPVFATTPTLALDIWAHVNGLLVDFARRHPDRVLVREVGQVVAAPQAVVAAVRERLGIPLVAAASTVRPELLTAAAAGRAEQFALLAPESLALLRTLRGLSGLEPDPVADRSPAAARDRLLADRQQLASLERHVRDAEAAAAEAAVRASAAETLAAAAESRVVAAEERAVAAEGRAVAAEANATVSRGRSETAGQFERIAALEATVTALRGSTSWRLTAPLRAVAWFANARLVPLGRRLAAHGRFAARRFSSPTAARRSIARAGDILRREGPAGLVRAIRAARVVDSPVVAPAGPTRDAEPRMPPFQRRPAAVSGPAAAPPLISIVMPVFETPADVLEATIRSVREQTSARWQLVAVDDASRAPHVAEILARHAADDGRIRIHRRSINGGIAAATNDGVGLATGEFVAFLDHDDLLAPAAIARCAAALAATGADVLYTDQDTVDDRGQVTWTFHKPDWSPEYLRHVMYVGHLLVVRRTLAGRLGFRSEFDGVQDFEFMLRLGEATRAIVHLPEVLYHWRAIAGSVAAAGDAKPGIDALQARAVQAHLDRLGVPGVAAVHPRFPHRCIVAPRLTHFPRVSIVIPSKDRPDLIGPCLDSIAAITSYPDVEVVVVDTGTTDARALEILRAGRARVVAFDRPFNFSAACNVGAAAATGAILVFLNNDTTVLSADWLHQLVFHLAAADVGAVGPLLLYPDGSVQHAGVVLGARGTADHVMRRFPADADGYAGSLSCPREVSAVTGACLAIRRDAFTAVGGWNELYATHYQDVDLCLRLRRLGLRCVFTPAARLTHHESPSRGSQYDFLDRLLLVDTWRDEIAAGDPAYPAACSLERLDYSPREAADALAG
jgi:GT2 family glycosyltransferase